MHQLHKLGAIVSLSARSPLHRHYTIDDIERLYGAAMASDQVKLFMASEYPEHFIVPRHDWPVAFVTWALMSDESRDAYVRQTRLLEGEDFVSGADLWVIDFVAPYGAVREIVRDVRADLSRPTGGLGRSTIGQGLDKRVRAPSNAFDRPRGATLSYGVMR